MPNLTAPDWLAPTDIWVPRGQKDAPVVSLIDNKILTTINKRTDVDSTAIIGRGGVAAVMDTGIPNDAYRFEWTHSNIFQAIGASPAQNTAYPASNLSQAQVEQAAGLVPLCGYEGDELEEGIFGMPHQAPQKLWWYAKRKAMYEAGTQPFRAFGTYGGGATFNGKPWNFYDGSNKMPNDSFFKAKLQSVQNARNSCDYFSLYESLGVGAFIKDYADTPDYAISYYQKAYAAEVMALGMGGLAGGIGSTKLCYLDWGKIEGLGDENGDLHNGFRFSRTVGGLGTVSAEAHPQVDYDFQVGRIFMIGFTRCRGYMPFDDRIKYGVNPLEVKATDPLGNPVLWTPGSAQNPPVTSAGYPTEPCRWLDAGFEAAHKYNQTSATAGEPWHYGKYRFAGSETWITPETDGTTILEHASAFQGPYATGQGARRGRPDVRFRYKNGNLVWAAFDPSRSKLTTETLILEPLPGKQFQVNLRGSVLTARTETI